MERRAASHIFIFNMLLNAPMRHIWVLIEAKLNCYIKYAKKEYLLKTQEKRVFLYFIFNISAVQCYSVVTTRNQLKCVRGI